MLPLFSTQSGATATVALVTLNVSYCVLYNILLWRKSYLGYPLYQYYVLYKRAGEGHGVAALHDVHEIILFEVASSCLLQRSL